MRLRQLFVILTLAIVGSANAQFPGMGGVAQSTDVQYVPFLLINPKVQKDMNLPPQTTQKVMSILMQEGMSMLSMGSSKGSQQSKVQAALEAVKRMETKTAALLTPSQRVRFHQLSLQYEGPSALIQPANARAVGLSPAQRTKLTGIIGAESSKMFSSIKAPDKSNPMGSLNNIVARQKEAKLSIERQLPHVLTPTQIKRWNAMQGRKIDNLDANPLGGMGM